LQPLSKEIPFSHQTAMDIYNIESVIHIFCGKFPFLRAALQQQTRLVCVLLLLLSDYVRLLGNGRVYNHKVLKEAESGCGGGGGEFILHAVDRHFYYSLVYVCGSHSNDYRTVACVSIHPIRNTPCVCFSPARILVYSSQATTKLYDHRHYYYYREKFLNHHKNILIIQPRGSVCCGAVAIAAPIRPCMVWFRMRAVKNSELGHRREAKV
jgi:hypothetical protein